MMNLTLPVPENVAAEYYAAAEQLNQRLPGASPKIDAKQLMAFALARHECQDICSQFDLALRLVKGGEPQAYMASRRREPAGAESRALAFQEPGVDSPGSPIDAPDLPRT